MEKGKRNPKGGNREEKNPTLIRGNLCRRPALGLLPGAKLLFASVVAKQMVSCAVQTDITWVKSDNPVRTKAPPPKGMQA